MNGSRSLVRVKIWLLELVFIASWLISKFDSAGWISQDLMFVAAVVASMLFFFVQCEECHTIEVLGRSDNPLANFLFLNWRGLLPPKNCPVCGKERI